MITSVGIDHAMCIIHSSIRLPTYPSIHSFVQALSKMVAVQDQKKKLNQLKSSFAKRLSHHLNNLFIHQAGSTYYYIYYYRCCLYLNVHLQNTYLTDLNQGNELGGLQLPVMNFLNELRLPSHSSCHKELMPYCDLMCWLKVVDPESFLKLKNVCPVLLICFVFCI